MNLFNKLEGHIYDRLAIMIVMIVFFLGVLNIGQTVKFDTQIETYCRQGLVQLPCNALAKIPNENLNLFNMYEWGGFLIWQRPNIKVFIDGRMSAWRDEQKRGGMRSFANITLIIYSMVGRKNMGIRLQ